MSHSTSGSNFFENHEIGKIRSVLVISLWQLGDALLTTPVFGAIKRANPLCKTSILVKRSCVPMVKGNTLIDEVIAVDDRKAGPFNFQRILENLKLVARLNNAQFQLVLDLTGNDRSRFMMLAAGAKWRFGHSRSKGFWAGEKILTKSIPLRADQSIVSQHLELLGVKEQKISEARLSFPENHLDTDRVRSLVPGGVKLAQIHPYSRIERKNWRTDRMAALVDFLAAKGFLPVLTGSAAASEMSVLQAISNQATSLHLNLAGKLSLTELGALSKMSSLFVGVDTAPMHIAAAVGTPVAALFGPSSETMWAPWCEKRLVISRSLPCRLPCKGKKTCSTFECIQDLSLSQVTEELDRFIRSL
jgi:heptosyltransferase-3